MYFYSLFKIIDEGGWFLIFDYIRNIFLAAISFLNQASVWIVISYIVAGILHDLLPVDKLHKHLRTKSLTAILKTTISGAFLPICSCGTIPLGISLYYSGAYIGPVLSFMTSTPIINPIAVILSIGLLGSKITVIYIACGLILPFIVGIVANTFSGKELFHGEIIPQETSNQETMIYFEDERTALQKISDGLKWVGEDFGLIVSKYVITGMLLAGFILTTFPDSVIQKYLGDPSALSLINIAILACAMYVCAVGHIPFIAALIAAGASPGSAITFLIAGASTNVAELISIYKMIGKRSAIIYGALISFLALVAGYVTNIILSDSFRPAISIDKIDYSIKYANRLIISFPLWLQQICSLIILILFVISTYKAIKSKLS